VLVLGLGIALACGGGDDASPSGADVAEQHEEAVAEEQVEAVDDGQDDGVTQEDAAAEHEEAEDSHEAADADGDGEANAYLEVAPKDALYLVKMTSFEFAPDVLEVAAGDVLEIAIQNVEPLLHDFTIDKIGADVHISYLGGSGEHAHTEPQREADVHFALTEPGSGVVHLRIYEPGEYVFYCTVPGHQEAGMVGTLHVVE
jgi:uncharacterized cupredoxin-like copper-binding protein